LIALPQPAGGSIYGKEELTFMVTKTDKSGVMKPKRSSKGMRKHVRRMKQEARKTAGTTISKNISQKPIQSGE
jgi:hypothetical protein